MQDAVTGVRYLGTTGRIDPFRTAIMGGSAGGYTVLQTMIDFPDVFTVGVCLFGVANLFTLATDTHKFEERYLDSLVGPLPEAAEVYKKRSPIFRASEITHPIAVFQGEIDEVVPKNQSDTIVEALRQNGVAVEYHVYEGEGHGWRKSETVLKFYSSLEQFLKQSLVFG